MGYKIDSDILFDLIYSELKMFLSPLSCLIPDDNKKRHFKIAIGGIIKKAGEMTDAEANSSEKPNGSDTISRQAAIEAFDCINGAEEVLRSLPAVQPEITLEQIEEYCRPRCLSIITNDLLCHLEQRQPKRTGEWIPCSQKLPGEDKHVLICLEDDPEEKYYCRMAVGWLEDGFWQCWDDRANTRKDVVAWMPLPESFKGGEDHETDRR